MWEVIKNNEKQLTCKDKTIQVTVTHDIPEERIQDLLCSAFEGGSNYWCQIDSLIYNYPRRETKASLGIEFPYLELPFKGGSLSIIGMEDDPKIDIPKILDLKAIKRGLRLMAEQEPEHFLDFLNENDDAITGDVFLQLCLFGKVIYG